MAGFWRALSYAGPAAVKGYNDEEDQLDKQDKRRTQSEADKAYGGTVGDVFGAVPLPPAVTGTLNQPYPQAPMPGQPPGQTMPGAPPPGTPTMQTGAPVPMPIPKPGSPTAAIPGATPMPQGAMASAPSFSQNGQDASNGVINEFGSPSPQGSPMAAPGQNALGQAGQWDLRTFVSRMKAQYPNLSPEALGAAVDRAMPWFNMQSQADARVLRAQLEQAKQDSLDAWRQRKGDHADDELKLRQQREARFAAAATAAAKLPPALKAQHDLLRNEYQAAETAFNVASRNLSYMTADMPGYDQAVEAYQQAQGVRMYATEKYENFVNNMPGAPRVPTTPQDQPQAGPAAAPAQAAPPASALPPGALETLPQGFKPKPVGIQGLNSYAPFTGPGGPPPAQGGEWSGQGDGEGASAAAPPNRIVDDTLQSMGHSSTEDLRRLPKAEQARILATLNRTDTYGRGRGVSKADPNTVPSTLPGDIDIPEGTPMYRGAPQVPLDSSTSNRLAAGIKPIEAERKAMTARHSAQRVTGLRNTDAAGAAGDAAVADAEGFQGPRWLYEMKQMLAQFPEIAPSLVNHLGLDMKNARGKASKGKPKTVPYGAARGS